MVLSIKERIARSQLRKNGNITLLDVPDVRARVNINFASQFISERVAPFLAGSFEDTRDKVRKKIKYAIQVGKLLPDADKSLVFGEFMAWAMNTKEWQEGLQGMPTISEGAKKLTMPKFTLDASLVQLPDTVEGCHQVIYELNAHFRGLLNEFDRQHSQKKAQQLPPEADMKSLEENSSDRKKRGRPRK